MATQRNHQDNFATNLTSNQIAGVTTTPLNSIPSIAAPFSIALDATNINGKYEIVEVTSKTATHINHASTTYAHTTAEEVRMIVSAAELDEFAAKTDMSNTGWVSISATLTYSSADAPTYVCTTSTDMTGSIGVGCRIKLTHSASTKYFIVTAIDASTITLYGGTDYTLAATAITAPYFSNVKAPLGFPVDPTKWTQTTTSVTEYSQATPVQDTWYNLNAALSLVVPIGAWRLEYFCDVYATDAGNVTGSIMTTLSTANNSESNTDFTCRQYVAGTVNSVITNQHRGATVVLAAKATNYLNVKCADGGAVDSVRINVSLGGDTTKTVIRAISAYL